MKRSSPATRKTDRDIRQLESAKQRLRFVCQAAILSEGAGRFVPRWDCNCIYQHKSPPDSDRLTEIVRAKSVFYAGNQTLQGKWVGVKKRKAKAQKTNKPK